MQQQRLGFQFEDLMAKMFSLLGFQIKQNVSINELDHRSEVDLIIKNGEITIFIEVKFYRDENIPSRSLEKAVNNFLRLTTFASERIAGLVIVSSYVSPAYKLYIRQEFGIVIWDRGDLYNVLKSTVEGQLLEELENLLLQAQQGLDVNDVFDKVDISNKSFASYIDDLNSSIPKPIVAPQPIIGINLCTELNATPEGRPGWALYEKKCIEILKYLFEDELRNWNTQNTTDDELSRFDMVCGIVKNTGFWGNLIQSFRTRYVLFEFKNYAEPIGQDQVYTTERYLYLKGLRSVGIIISRKGGKPQAIKACKGALREHDKLILILDNDDLCKMLKMKDNGDNPSDYLSDKLDSFLISLSR